MNELGPSGKHLGLVTVPAIKGSRQGITVMLASAILRNKKTYLQYMHGIRADQRGHSSLAKKVHDRLQDEYMMAAVAARSMAGVGMTQPMMPLTRSTATGRQDVYCMMACLGNYINGLGHLEEDAPPDVLKLTA